MPNHVCLSTNLPGMTARSGKVRDVYTFGDRLLFIATDRLSAFDWVLPTGIPDKGRILTGLSEFWFGQDWLLSGTNVQNHLLSMDPASLPLPTGADLAQLAGRSMVVRRTEVVPIECVARGYLAGSGWKDYRQTGAICGVPLPKGLVECDELPEPIFTPTTKAAEGHDEAISFEDMSQQIGGELAERLRDVTLTIYSRAAQFAKTKGILLADTKFEFGLLNGELYLIDEVLTPDSSRFWPEDQYEPGHNQPSFDKQFVRDWLESTTWDKHSPPPPLPPEIVSKTREKYAEAYERLTGSVFD